MKEEQSNIRIFILEKYLTIETADREISNESEMNQYGVVGYHMLQLIAYGTMAFLIMRLKLLWTPYLCILASLIANETESFDLITQFLKTVKNKTFGSSSKTIILVMIVSLMSYQGVQNITKQHSNKGEYSSYTQEKLMNWINEKTNVNDAFIGTYFGVGLNTVY